MDIGKDALKEAVLYLHVFNNCKVSDKDRRYGKRALFRHFSKWLFVHPYQATSLPRAIDTEIDNVAFAIKLILSQVSLNSATLIRQNQIDVNV